MLSWGLYDDGLNHDVDDDVDDDGDDALPACRAAWIHSMLLSIDLLLTPSPHLTIIYHVVFMIK